MVKIFSLAPSALANVCYLSHAGGALKINSLARACVSKIWENVMITENCAFCIFRLSIAQVLSKIAKFFFTLAESFLPLICWTKRQVARESSRVRSPHLEKTRKWEPKLVDVHDLCSNILNFLRSRLQFSQTFVIFGTQRAQNQLTLENVCLAHVEKTIDGSIKYGIFMIFDRE